MTAALLGWVLHRIDATAVGALLLGADPVLLLVAAAMVPAQVLLAARRWRLGCAALGVALGAREATLEYALSTLLNQVLPGGMAGDAVRVWRQRGPERPMATVLRAAAGERMVGLLVHGVAVLGGLLAWPTLHPGVPRPLGALPLVGVLLVGLGGAIATTARAMLVPTVLVRQILASVLFLGTLLVAFEACGRAIGMELGAAVFTVIPLTLLAMVAPISIGGWGLREATAVALLPQLGLTAEQALALSTAYGLTSLAGALPGVVVPWVRR
ncbi:MAG: flippase-like domain-containing protein [Alphaproteobacteria bacterium]|nr:flippase-like domain-containing protein [Alphaproteobacteria bacterium]